MSRQSVLSQSQRKKPGPPPTGKGTLVGVRLQPPELARVDDWIAKQDEVDLSRPEALRRLAARGLAAEPAESKPHQRAEARKPCR
jgi:hypothetical protein